MAYDSSKGEVYVTNMADNTVSVISDITHSVIATVNMVPQPNIYSSLPQACAAAYDSANGKIYVAIPYKDRVSTILDRTHSVIENISVGIAPQDIVYNSGTREIFVLSRESIGPNHNLSTLSILSDTTNKVVATVNLNQSWAIALAYDFGKGEIFLTDSSTNTVIVIAHSSITYSAPTELNTLTKIMIGTIVILFAAITVSFYLFLRHRKTQSLPLK
jgi:YVTN family beta-propeller protein